MLLLLYKFLMFISLPFVYIILYFRKQKGLETSDKSRKKERFGIASVTKPKGRVIWFNASSVGESNSIVPVINELLKLYPDDYILITTTTVTAADNIKKKFENKRVIHQFLPIDRRSFVDKFFNYWKPSIGFFVDSDFWPNLIFSANAHSILLILLNGRISDRSYKRYCKHLNFIKPIMKNFTLAFGKSEEDTKRLSDIGAKKTICVGNLKYALPPLTCNLKELNELKTVIKDRKIFVLSSTHEGEEILCLEAFKKIKKEFSDTLMIIAPRHPVRGEEIKQICYKAGCVSSLRSKKEDITDKTDIYIADTMGELGLFYSLSNIVFVGGSLVKWGGHNPMEPARLNNVVLSGSYVFNFKETFDLLLKENAIIIVSDENELANKVIEIFRNPDKAKTFMDTAFKVSEREATVLDRVMEKINIFLNLYKTNQNLNS